MRVTTQPGRERTQRTQRKSMKLELHFRNSLCIPCVLLRLTGFDLSSYKYDVKHALPLIISQVHKSGRGPVFSLDKHSLIWDIILGSGAAHQADGRRHREMTIKEIKAKSILSKSQIYEYALNAYVGCQY